MAGKLQTHFSLIPRFFTITVSHSDICMQRSEVKRLAIVYERYSSGCDKIHFTALQSCHLCANLTFCKLSWVCQMLGRLFLCPLVITASTGLPFSLPKPQDNHSLSGNIFWYVSWFNYSYILKVWSPILLTYTVNSLRLIKMVFKQCYILPFAFPSECIRGTFHKNPIRHGERNGGERYFIYIQFLLSKE